MKIIYFNSFLLSFICSISCFAGYNTKIVIRSDGNAYLNLYTEEGSRNILRYNRQSKVMDKYYPIQNQENCHINDSSIDPKGNMIAFFGYCKLQNISQSNLSAEGYYYLTIVDIKTKKIIVSFDHGGQLFSFSPQGDAIVYAEEIPGEPGSPAPPGYQGGVWLYNFNTKSKIKLDTSPVSPYGIRDINWSEHDGYIYLAGYLGKSIRYDVNSGKSELSPYKGIYFSSDGKYSVYTPFEGNARIFNTTNNKVMSEWGKLILAEDKNQYPSMGFQFWSKKLNAGVFSVGGEKNVVFDVGQGKVIGVFPGYVVGTNPDGTLVAIHPLGPDNQRKIEILNLLDLIQPKSSE